MKIIIIEFSFLFFCLCNTYCQYNGGTGKGVAKAVISANLGNNIYTGGGNDGIAFVKFSANLGNSIYTGGGGGGFDRNAVTANLGNNIYKGGANDGVAHGANAISLGANIFAGGTGDGETKAASTSALGTNIYKGGGGDGWAMVAVSQLALPVTLSNFTGAWQQNDALLSWQTSAEYNTHYFELERSFNGTDYSLVSTIAAAGTSNTLKEYKYNDSNIKTHLPAAVATLYYRLKTVDKDGKESYSAVVVLKTDKTGDVYAIYPNPARQFIIVTVNNELLNAHGMIRLADQSGKILLIKTIGNLKERIDVAQLATGIYYVQLLDNKGLLYTQKLIINQ